MTSAHGKVPIKFTLNGNTVEMEVASTMNLLELIRRDFRLTAAKEGCGKGECGACTVLLNGEPINSCLKFAATLTPDDEVLTLEGLAEDQLMRSLQQAYVDEGAVQCGFCIPGIVLSSYHLLLHNPSPSAVQIKDALAGNLCRCTGYRKIEEAVKTAAKQLSPRNASRGLPQTRGGE